MERHGGVWFSQEIWLPENRLSELCDLGVQFVAHSGMENAVTNSIMRGRPYGGLCLAWSPDLDHVIRPLVNYRHERIVCVESAANPHPLLFVSVYMPYFNSAKRQECIAETIETISMLEEIISDHPFHQLIIRGDFNTEMKGYSPFDSLWADFTAKHYMTCCEQQQHQLYVLPRIAES